MFKSLRARHTASMCVYKLMGGGHWKDSVEGSEGRGFQHYNNMQRICVVKRTMTCYTL